jgi:tight adherence protein C
MSPLLMLLLAAGALTGTGVALTAAGISRRPPALAAVLAALDERTMPAAAERVSWWTRLVRRVPGAVPDSDVAVLAWSRDRFLLTRVTTTIGYAAAGPALATLSGLLDLGLPLAVPAVFTLAGALLGWTGAARSVRVRAEDAREELRFALVSFLQQAGLLRQGGAGVATALSLPARLLADGWAMRRIADELAIAERAGQMPWEGLRRFGEQVGVDELTDLSAIAAGAGQDGAAVVDTLLKRAESLRDELLADEHAGAHRASGQMSTPGALQVFLIATWVLYPAAVALLSF